MTISRPCRQALPLMLAVALSGCSFKDKVDATFGDQHFKTAIALIELFKVRHRQYPSSLKAIDFAGGWDQIAITSVDYRKLDDGYELNVRVGGPKLGYPAEFWSGLGLKKSNVNTR